MSIYQHVLTFIHRPRAESFEQLAIEVFRHQFASVTAYRNYCLELGVDSSAVKRIDDIPAVSNVAFKYVDLSDESSAQSRDALTFLTSGTTQGRERRGRHAVPRPEIYRASAIAHLRTMLFPDDRKTAMLALHPTADAMPESSLATMIGWCIAEFGSGRTFSAASREGVDLKGAMDFLDDAETRREPVCIMGTTAAFAALNSAARERGVNVSLAAGSRLMDTGGLKGQAMPLSAAAVIQNAQANFGIAPAMVINEYGMTELCSQLYDATEFNCRDAATSRERFKLAPAWLRVSARNPATQRRVDDGEPGLLTFFDLANVGSVSAVMSEDVGIVEGDRVRVIGRSAMGAARGCALAIGQFAKAAAPDGREIARPAQ
ncbi:MAG: hypothetical protein Q7S58_21590 [Candidatus Binatus sp.]|uniref:LuxE/PaaK family acyltransferase n=1 Tax=Candidatus Binatus sp. TaxID=2811406 RepID=UPI0027218641|nr:hypothetical protein [Candidatus Binatus sp.]MDO8435000.1 hypothetical protein [Candidatus Binatus sp.]